MFPVGFAGGLKFEGPICFENGTTASWHVSWAPERYTKTDDITDVNMINITNTHIQWTLHSLIAIVCVHYTHTHTYTCTYYA